MIEPQAIEAVIHGISTALEDADCLEAFRRGELSFLLDREGITILERGQEPPPIPQHTSN